jgi:hypothetical protein
MTTTKLRTIVKVTRQASGKSWQVGLWVPADFGHGHVISRVIADGFETRKLALVFYKALRAGKVKPVSNAHWAEAHIDDGVIVIRVPVSVLPDALRWDPRVDHSGVTVTDADGFARDVVREMNREEEDGSTAVHLLFDRAMAEAIEQGSAHVEVKP